MAKKFKARIGLGMPLLALLLAVFFAMACGGGSDSSAPLATQDLSGVVSDPAIEGATVTLVDDSGVVTDFTATTDSEGKFSIAGVPAGESEVEPAGRSSTGGGLLGVGTAVLLGQHGFGGRAPLRDELVLVWHVSAVAQSLVGVTGCNHVSCPFG